MKTSYLDLIIALFFLCNSCSTSDLDEESSAKNNHLLTAKQSAAFYDNLGRSIIRKEMTNGVNNYNIDLSNYNSGI
ncbi:MULTISPECIES: T9SS type A sorting domain-containing protein [Flavobacterium]|uniref:T9SS type A sorting domain-containing protein n=1 Tax=Flavobacterium jumunjinense TaxID=998845 RepID=A0ABV5GJI3_9FLAO|nr:MULTISPECIES: T9SS type A sorting domain-containing protein [Flavobacterium]